MLMCEHVAHIVYTCVHLCICVRMHTREHTGIHMCTCCACVYMDVFT